MQFYTRHNEISNLKHSLPKWVAIRKINGLICNSDKTHWYLRKGRTLACLTLNVDFSDPVQKLNTSPK